MQLLDLKLIVDQKTTFAIDQMPNLTEETSTLCQTNSCHDLCFAIFARIEAFDELR